MFSIRFKVENLAIEWLLILVNCKFFKALIFVIVSSGMYTIYLYTIPRIARYSMHSTYCGVFIVDSMTYDSILYVLNLFTTTQLSSLFSEPIESFSVRNQCAISLNLPALNELLDTILINNIESIKKVDRS